HLRRRRVEGPQDHPRGQGRRVVLAGREAGRAHRHDRRPRRGRRRLPLRGAPGRPPDQEVRPRRQADRHVRDVRAGGADGRRPARAPRGAGGGAQRRGGPEAVGERRGRVRGSEPVDGRRGAASAGLGRHLAASRRSPGAQRPGINLMSPSNSRKKNDTRPPITPVIDSTRKNTMNPSTPYWAICITNRRRSGVPQARAARPIASGSSGNRLITAWSVAVTAARPNAFSSAMLPRERNTAATTVLRNATTR